MKSKEEIEERLKIAEKQLEQLLKDIKECDSYEFMDLLIDNKIHVKTLINTLIWVLKN